MPEGRTSTSGTAAGAEVSASDDAPSVPEPASGASGSGGAEGASNAADSGAEDAAGVDAGWAQPVKKSVNASSTATVRFIESAPFHLSDIEVPEKAGFSAPRREFPRAGAARIKSAVSRQQ